jgi:SAM-dependent methyltransferase
MATGNWIARSLAVALRLGLFEHDGLTMDDVAGIVGGGARPARMLTDVLVAAELLRRDGEILRNAPLADAYLKQVATYRDAPPTPQEAQRLVREAIQGLHGITTMAAEAMLDHLDLTDVHKTLDLGGGSGAMAIVLAQRLPQARVQVVDQEPVLKVIRDNAMQAGVLDRLDLLHLDFFSDALPRNVDLVTLSNILHDWSREQGRILLRRAYDSLRPGGRLAVNEWLLADDRSGPLLSALMSLCMLIETTAGENLAGQEIATAMADCGFARVETIPTLFPHGIVTGLKL